MKIKFPVLMLVAILFLQGCSSLPVNAPSKAVPKLADGYAYTSEPQICFFPKAKAQWDGYKITNQNWNKLTDYLKLMFILEGVRELEKTKSAVIVLEDNNRALQALNYGLTKLNNDLPKERIQALSFLYDILNKAKMVSLKKAKKG